MILQPDERVAGGVRGQIRGDLIDGAATRWIDASRVSNASIAEIVASSVAFQLAP